MEESCAINKALPNAPGLRARAKGIFLFYSHSSRVRQLAGEARLLYRGKVKAEHQQLNNNSFCSQLCFMWGLQVRQLAVF